MSQLPAPRCILFDLDGTLVDSVADISASANFVRESLGMEPLPISELTRYVGDGAARLMQRALAGRYDAPPEIDGVDVREALRAFRAHYHEHCLTSTKPYPGVVETLGVLAPLPMAIVSNKPEPMCVTIAEGLGLSGFLGAVVGARPSVPVKPDPSLLLAALSELGVADVGPDIWMVGDSRNDVLAAREIGASAVAVGWGLTEASVLLELQPDLMLSEFAELASRV
jgi:phosphoglycolate phosphatase